MNNWNRQYRLVAGVAGQQGFELGEETKGRAIHIAFDLEKTDTQASNTGKIQLWNLSDAHKAILNQEGCVVELRVGYGNVMNPIFLGDVTNPTESLENSDRMIELEMVEGRTAYQQIASLSYTGVVQATTILGELINKMGIASVLYTPTATALIATVNYDNGYAFVGRVKDAFTQVCDRCGVKWTMQNGIIQIYKEGEPITTQAYVLNANTGLINIPKKVTISTESGDVAGYEIEYFINGAIGINDMIEVNSNLCSGYFRVYSQHYQGDNYDGGWSCTAQILEVKA